MLCACVCVCVWQSQAVKQVQRLFPLLRLHCELCVCVSSGKPWGLSARPPFLSWFRRLMFNPSCQNRKHISIIRALLRPAAHLHVNCAVREVVLTLPFVHAGSQESESATTTPTLCCFCHRRRRWCCTFVICCQSGPSAVIKEVRQLHWGCEKGKFILHPLSHPPKKIK